MHQRILIALLTASLTLSAAAQSYNERFQVIVRGTGPDVVLIPGLMSSNAAWDTTAKHLEAHYRLHLIQVAGFAGAPARANAKGPILQPLVNALDSYIKTNKLNKPPVMGHSMGGFVALMLAQQHPEDCGRVMVVDALPFAGLLFGITDASTAGPQAKTFCDKMRTQSDEEFAQAEGQFLHVLVKSKEGYTAGLHWAIASDRSVSANAMYELMTTDIRPHLAEIKTPITIVYAWDEANGFSQAITAGFYENSYEALPNKKLVCVPHSFHFIMADQPAAFNTRVDEFLK